MQTFITGIFYQVSFFDALYIAKYFHSNGKVTITGEMLQILTLCSALMAIEQ